DWRYAAPTKAPSQLTLDDKFDVKKGTTLLLVGTTGVRLLTVAEADEVQDSFAGRTAVVTRLRFEEWFDPKQLDRRTTVLHELVGPPIRFAGTAYPATVTERTVLLPGRRID